MDLRSYIELKEAYVNMMRPQQEVFAEEVEYVDEEILDGEGTLLEFETQDDLDAQLAQSKQREKQRAAERAAAVRRDAAIYRAGGGDARRRELEAPTNPDGTRRNLGFGGRKGGAGEAAWETRQQGERNLYRAGGGDAASKTGLTRQQIIDRGIQATSGKSSSSSSSSSASASGGGRGAKGSTLGSGNNGAGSSGGGSRPAAGGSSGGGSRPAAGGSSGGGSRPASSTGSSSAPAPAPAAKAAPAKQTGDKAKDMATWAKANPKLAAAKAERDRTRGTSATTNPLMQDMKSRLPAPASKKTGGAAAAASTSGSKFNPNAPKVASTTRASSAGGAKAAASRTGPKFNPAASRIAMGSNKVTTQPSAGAKAALAAGSKFNPNAPKIKLTNSVDMSEFDIIIEHLVEQGFPVEEALKLMVNMSEEKREQIIAERSREFDEPRAAQNAAGARGPELSHSAKKTTKPLSTSKTVGSSTDRGPEFRQRKPLSTSKTVGSSVDRGPEFRREEVEIEEGMHREADTGKVVDKAEIGKTYYPNMPKKKSSVALRKEKEAAEKKKPTNKESFDSLAAAYESVFAPKEEISEEEADRLRDKRQERGGVDGNKRYPGFASATETKKFGSGKTAAQKEAEEKYGKGATAMDIVKANLEKKYGKGAVMGSKKKEGKKD